VSIDLPNFSLGCQIDYLLDGVDFNDDVDLLADADSPTAGLLETVQRNGSVLQPPVFTKPVIDHTGTKNVPTFPVVEKVPAVNTNGQLTVLVDNRELRTPVCGLLRNKFNLKTVVAQLSIGDYIASNRIGIERKSRSGTSLYAFYVHHSVI
jgi:hypothetical protein